MPFTNPTAAFPCSAEASALPSCHEHARLLLSLVLVAGSVFAEPLIVSPAPFNMRVVDAHTGEGVPGLRITTDNGIVCYTLLDGTASWGESSLMGRAVRFQIQDDTHRFGGLDTTLPVMRGGRSTLTVTTR